MIDIRATTPDDLELSQLRDFNAQLAERFPETKSRTSWNSHIQLQSTLDEPSVTAEHAVRGYSFFASNTDRVVQVRGDGFTFSKLKPYESWAQLQTEAEELWARYREVARPIRVERLAVRYLNHFPLPEGSVQLDELFNAYPTIPDALGAMDEYLVRFVVGHPDNSEYRAIVTQASMNSGIVILDIDVFTDVQMDPEDGSIWSILADLREFKNDVFFSTITKATERSLL